MNADTKIYRAERETGLHPEPDHESLNGVYAASKDQKRMHWFRRAAPPGKHSANNAVNIPALLCALLLTGAWIASLQYAHRMTYSSYPILGYTVLLIVIGGTVALWRLVVTGGSGSLERIFGRYVGRTRIVICLLIGIAGLYLRWRVIAPVSGEATGDTAMLYAIAKYASGAKVSSEFIAVYSRYLALTPSSFGYPAYVLTHILTDNGESIRAILIFNMVFTAAGIAFAVNLARLSFGSRAMIPAAVLVSIWPSSIASAQEATAFPYFILCLMIVLNILAYLFQDKESSATKFSILPLLLIFAGILLGHMTFLCPEGHVTALAVALALVTHRIPRLSMDNHRTGSIALSVRWVRLALVLVPMLLTIFITWERLNILIGQPPVFSLGELGYDFMVGMNAEAGGVWNQQDADFYQQLSASSISAFQVQWTCFLAGWARFIENPLMSLHLIADVKRLYVWQRGALLSEIEGFLGPYPLQLLYVLGLTGAMMAAFKSFFGRLSAMKPLFMVLGGLILYSVIFEARTDTQLLILPLILVIAGGFSVQPAAQNADVQRMEDVPNQKDTNIMTETEFLNGIRAGHLHITVTQACMKPVPDTPKPFFIRDEHQET